MDQERQERQGKAQKQWEDITTTKRCAVGKEGNNSSGAFVLDDLNTWKPKPKLNTAVSLFFFF